MTAVLELARVDRVHALAPWARSAAGPPAYHEQVNPRQRRYVIPAALTLLLIIVVIASLARR